MKKPWSTPYRGQPYFVSEFGGIWWNPNLKKTDKKQQVSWGYGKQIKSVDEFYDRFDGLCGALLDNPQMFGYCYTQLTDVYQEENGIYDFSRRPKFDIDRVCAVQRRPAAIERLHAEASLGDGEAPEHEARYDEEARLEKLVLEPEADEYSPVPEEDAVAVFV